MTFKAREIFIAAVEFYCNPVIIAEIMLAACLSIDSSFYINRMNHQLDQLL
ncbi:hypothetical protein [Oceanobacillus massiliensis]|uniref:hypothetical protein n=1 Tax=Oceanobacillus massiliensis TaxID=1465765 RepID=UPI0003183956